MGVSVLTCFDSSKAEYVCCPVQAAAEEPRPWLLLTWMESPGSGAPSSPDPTDMFNQHEKNWHVSLTSFQDVCWFGQQEP